VAEYGKALQVQQNMAEVGKSLQVWQKTTENSRKQKNKKESSSFKKPMGYKTANDNADNNVHVYTTSPAGHWPTPYLNDQNS